MNQYVESLTLELKMHKERTTFFKESRKVDDNGGKERCHILVLPAGPCGNQPPRERQMAKPKIKISANEVLEDIRSGMDDEGFMLKYTITYRQLQALFRKLIKAGYISPLELAERLCVTQSQVTEVMDQVTKAIDELD
jgi:hypothetical protein